MLASSPHHRVDIGTEVFLGAGTIVVNGRCDRRLRIGQGAVRGAGSAVTKNVPDGARWSGNPPSGFVGSPASFVAPGYANLPLTIIRKVDDDLEKAREVREQRTHQDRENGRSLDSYGFSTAAVNTTQKL